mmetsp:Transcript_22738/g.47206  ORF Transcript_22738/g.47206 Transcript_22738/m.47206 type:complete len:425 (-) Transcript_22738:3956-5230(-)
MSSSTQAIRKLKREYASLAAEPPHVGITVRPLEANFLHAHFLLSGEVFYDTPYEGGVYHGVLKFPKEYPFKPPSIICRTPSGRFKINEKICFSMSDFHPESWQPSWTIRTILNGFVSFMNGNDITTGGIDAPSAMRIRCARDSLSYCMEKDDLAMKIFGDVLEEINNERKEPGTAWPPSRPARPVCGQNASSSTTRVTQASAKPTVEQGSGKNAAKNKKKREKEKRKKLAARFLLDLKEQVPSFVSSVREELEKQFGLDVSSLQADHVCYRTDAMEQYTTLVDALRSSSDTFSMLVESEVGGRPIATFRLAMPIASSDGIHSVNVIEIPSPKQGSPYKAGLEHIEFVIGDSTHMSPTNHQVHQSVLKAWMDKHPSVEWDTRAITKDCNPDVSMKIELPDYGHVSVKFHLVSLENVIKVELEEPA